MTENKDQNTENKKKILNLIVFGIVIVAVMLIWGNVFNSGNRSLDISYTEFKNQITAGNVVSVKFEGIKVEGILRSELTINGESSNIFTSTLPPYEDPDLSPLLEEKGVNVTSNLPTDDGFVSGLVINLIFIGLLIAFWIFMMRRMSGNSQGQLSSFTKGHHKQYKKENSKITFADVAGMEGAKEDLEEVVEFLKNPEKFKRLGAKIPKGVLLIGPPGTGKTLISRAVAGQAEVPFFSLSGSEFIEMLVGVGAARVRSLFRDAKKNEPSIIFIDEIDSIGRVRGTGLGGGHDEREQTLNQLLSEMDGFESHDEVIILAATNRPDVLDAALLRPGRFDRKVVIDNPQLKERLAILKIHARNKPLADDVELEDVAKSTAGFAGADLENILNEAALMAARRGKNEIEKVDLRDATDKVLIGNERKGLLNEDEKKPVAYHEAGHAILGWMLPNADPIHKISIVPRGMSLGHTFQLPEKDKHLQFKKTMEDRLVILLGGRASEEIFLDDISSGAAGDFKAASHLSKNMVCLWGMSEEIGNLYIDTEESHPFLGRSMAVGRSISEKTAEKIDSEVKRILQEAEEKACKILKENSKAVNALVELLLEKETVTGQELDDLMKELNIGKLSE
jgi:cell division protease FtsH